MSGKGKWAIYEHARGVVWSVSPATRANAERECGLIGEGGHEAMPRKQAEAMRNAWATGRLAGIESMRKKS